MTGVGRVLVVGDVAVDYYLRLPSSLASDEKITAESAVRLPGGTGANAAVAAHVLGSDVSLYSAVGDDPQGRWLIAALAGRGIRADGISVFPGTTTQATILLTGGARQVIVDRGVADLLDALDPPPVVSSDVVYLTGHAAAIARLAGVSTSAGYVVGGIEAGMAGEPRLTEALPKLGLVLTNSTGYAAFAGRLPAGLPVIETRGAEGAVIHHGPGRAEPVPAVPVRSVDATGAGDCLAGALCHYLAAGLDLGAAIRLAVTAAALSTRALGAQTALPDDAEVRAAAKRRTS